MIGDGDGPAGYAAGQEAPSGGDVGIPPGKGAAASKEGSVEAEKPLPKAGVWSSQRIASRFPKEAIVADEHGVSDYKESRLDPAGYRLSLGGEVYVSPAKAKDKASIRTLKPHESFFIPPGQFAFLLTEEVVKVPKDAFALIALRSRSKFKGLVNVSGFHADPGYDGRLVFAVFNAGPGDVHLKPGRRPLHDHPDRLG